MANSVLYPEHEKLDTEALSVVDQVAEWLESQGYSIEKFDENVNRNVPINWNNARLEFFGADPKIIEEERIEMLGTAWQK